MTSHQIQNNEEFIFIQNSKKKLIIGFWLLVYAIICLFFVQTLIPWNSFGELLLSISVALALMIGLGACFYDSQKLKNSH